METDATVWIHVFLDSSHIVFKLRSLICVCTDPSYTSHCTAKHVKIFLHVCVQNTQFHPQLNMLRFAVLMCIISIVLIQCTPTRRTVCTQHFITIIQKATFRLHKTAIAISFQVTEISEEICIAVPVTNSSCKGEISTKFLLLHV